MACQKWGVGNDPEAMGLAFDQESTSTDAHCQATTNLVDEDWGLSKQTFVQPGFLIKTIH